jgi:hypothetical protein
MSEQIFDAEFLSNPAGGLAQNFELLLTYLAEDHPWLPEPENLNNRARFLGASRALARRILQAEAGALRDAMDPWLGQLVRKWYDDQTTVITFNYDTLIEKAYTEVVGQAVNTDHIDLYAIPVTDIGTRTRPSGRRATPTMRYLKLHGSVNWCYSGAASFFGVTIYDLYIKPGWGAASAEPDDDLEQKAPEKVHLVVPPTTSKSALFNNEIVRSQWRIARTALEDASVIYCFGYSLPETDQMVRYLLSTLGGSKW